MHLILINIYPFESYISKNSLFIVPRHLAVLLLGTKTTQLLIFEGLKTNKFCEDHSRLFFFNFAGIKRFNPEKKVKFLQ